MTARAERRTESRRELNRRTVNQAAATHNQSSFSRTEWEALDRNGRKQLTVDAQAAVNRLDDGDGRPGDSDLAAIFEAHCQRDAFTPPTYCVHGQGDGCNSCFLDHDDLVRRSEDL